MSKIRRRKGNRQESKSPSPIVVYIYGERIEGTVLDTSATGLGVLLPASCGLSEQQSVRILHNRQQKMAKVARIEQTEQGDRVGLKLIG